jgi:hypothetical protein
MGIDSSAGARLAAAIVGLALAASLAGCSPTTTTTRARLESSSGSRSCREPCPGSPRVVRIRRWDGPIHDDGCLGCEPYEDANGQRALRRVGEPYEDDPRNDPLDPQSKGKYDGIYMAGFGGDRVALGSPRRSLGRARSSSDDGKTRGSPSP